MSLTILWIAVIGVIVALVVWLPELGITPRMSVPGGLPEREAGIEQPPEI